MRNTLAVTVRNTATKAKTVRTNRSKLFIGIRQLEIVSDYPILCKKYAENGSSSTSPPNRSTDY
jgi:hypothetical protein